MKTKTNLENLNQKLKYTRMGSRRALVAVCRRCFSPLVGTLDEIRELVLRRDLVAAEIRNVDVF